MKKQISTLNNVALSCLNSTKAKTDNEKQRKELKRGILNLSNDLFKQKESINQPMRKCLIWFYLNQE
jgi:hypothetical protein